jgi:hypothetical protein
MKQGSYEWIWFIVVAAVWLLQLLRQHRSAGKRDKPRPVPTAKPKRRPETRREPVGEDQRFGGRKAVASQIRELVDQIRRSAQPPVPAPDAPAPIRETVSAPRPVRAAPPPIVDSVRAPPSKLPPPSSSPIAEPQPTPTAVWAEALRDKQNLRRIIIAAEIIGPPKGG